MTPTTMRRLAIVALMSSGVAWATGARAARGQEQPSSERFRYRNANITIRLRK